MVARPFADSVFVNCAFDAAFLPLLHALAFTIPDCGFFARIAMEPGQGTEFRLDKIARLIRDSRLSIHDLSRLPADSADLPRFNMPLECGLALGAIRFGKKSKPARGLMFMTAESFQDKKTISDLAGPDPIAHGNDPGTLVAKVRRFLSDHSAADGTPVRGGEAVLHRYQAFLLDLPMLAAGGRFGKDEVQTFDYLTEWIALAAKWIEANP